MNPEVQKYDTTKPAPNAIATIPKPEQPLRRIEKHPRPYFSYAIIRKEIKTVNIKYFYQKDKWGF